MRSRAIYSHVPYRGIVKVHCGDNCQFQIESQGHNIENGLYWGGLFAHEPETMRIWTDHARKVDMVLDIGANSGVFALAAATVGATNVHAFEPLPRVYKLLQRNVSINETTAIKTWQMAMGSTKGLARMFDPGGDAPTSASLSEEFATAKFSRLREVDVQVTTVDLFCSEHGIQGVDLIKIDVEGFEEHALQGMRQVVAASKPIILMEVLPGEEVRLRSTVSQLWPDLYIWESINEGKKHVSRNVMLIPCGPSATGSC